MKHALLVPSLFVVLCSSGLAHAGEAAQHAAADTVYVFRDAPSGGNMEKLLRYENGKKDVGTAVILGLLIPGAGDFYAGSPGTGFLLLGAAVAGFVMAADSNDPTTGQSILLAAVLTSPISAGMEASGHNKKLKKELGIAVRPSADSPAIALVCSF